MPSSEIGSPKFSHQNAGIMDINYWDNMSNPFCEASIIIIITIIIIIIMIMFQLFNLVGGFNPSEKYESQLG